MKETLGIIASILIVFVVGFVLFAPRAWVAKLLGGK